MSITSAPDSGPAPIPQPPPPRRGLGNVRSMVISMVVILAAVLAWVAMVPRVREVNQPAVDVTSVARHVRQESDWAISQPRLPTGWRATNVRFGIAAGGPKTWHAGYLSPDGNYVSIDQTEVSSATDSWVSALTANGQDEGSLAIASQAGATWRKLSSADPDQRSLVSSGSGANALTTVLSGTAPYAQLVQFAEALEVVPEN